MTNSIFGNTPASFDEASSLFGNSSDTAASQPSYDIEGIMQQLMAQTGCSAQEAADAVARQLAKQKSTSTPAPQTSYFQLRTKEEKAEYMRQLNANAAQQVWIPEQWKEIERGDISVAEAQAQFTQNMKAKATNTNAHIIEQMRKLREGE